MDDNNYVLRDAKKEREIGFSLPVSLANARKAPLLKVILHVSLFNDVSNINYPYDFQCLITILY